MPSPILFLFGRRFLSPYQSFPIRKIDIIISYILLLFEGIDILRIIWISSGGRISFYIKFIVITIYMIEKMK